MTIVKLDNYSAEYLAAKEKWWELMSLKGDLISLVPKLLDEDEDITDILIRLKMVKKEMALAHNAWQEVINKEARENKS